MRHWKLNEIDTPDGTRSPVVLHSRDGEGRVVLIALDAGQELGEHQVKEAALLLVVAGNTTIDAGEQSVDAGAGDLFRFEPDERRSVRSRDGARVVLFLAPWPGEGHYRGGDAAMVTAS
ncbi:MAG TPA: AraC family ligand binding domain-containing protein [Gaiellaceae bacterium]|nr:AraC family ligand binding domain-containing protein [Gaiellaceae bacterium]